MDLMNYLEKSTDAFVLPGWEWIYVILSSAILADHYQDMIRYKYNMLDHCLNHKKQVVAIITCGQTNFYHAGISSRA